MKNLALLLPVCTLLLTACQLNEQPDQTSRKQTYLIHKANFNPAKGTATFTELEPGKLQITISLQNTEAGFEHPAHLHFGSIREVGELACQLNPVDGATGSSVTILDQVKLSSEETLTYDMLLNMNGSIKIHMDGGYFKDMVLAFGNIGKNEDYLFDGVAVCTGH